MTLTRRKLFKSLAVLCAIPVIPASRLNDEKIPKAPEQAALKGVSFLRVSWLAQTHEGGILEFARAIAFEDFQIGQHVSVSDDSEMNFCCYGRMNRLRAAGIWRVVGMSDSTMKEIRNLYMCRSTIG